MKRFLICGYSSSLAITIPLCPSLNDEHCVQCVGVGAELEMPSVCMFWFVPGIVCCVVLSAIMCSNEHKQLLLSTIVVY